MPYDFDALVDDALRAAPLRSAKEKEPERWHNLYEWLYDLPVPDPRGLGRSYKKGDLMLGTKAHPTKERAEQRYWSKKDSDPKEWESIQAWLKWRGPVQVQP